MIQSHLDVAPEATQQLQLNSARLVQSIFQGTINQSINLPNVPLTIGQQVVTAYLNGDPLI